MQLKIYRAMTREKTAIFFVEGRSRQIENGRIIEIVGPYRMIFWRTKRLINDEVCSSGLFHHSKYYLTELKRTTI